ncbi:MAG: efflux RND transporter periplasmic adaptor subunit [Verrucomicrobiota bacterium JB022]|nr:efflux RND transporter periplasmic adaptor subunit [Verrucomicrobiota bacterium JB022]
MKWLLRLGLPLLLIVAVWFLLGYMLRPSVLVVAAGRGTAVDAITGNVSVQARYDINVRSEAYGKIIGQPVDKGAFVKAGDVLSRQETTQTERKLEAFRVQLKAAQEVDALPLSQKFDIANLEEALESAKIAANVGQRSTVEVERLTRDLEKTENLAERSRIEQEKNVAYLQAQIALLELELEQLTVTAPYEGQIVDVFRYPGDLVHGATDLMRLVSNERRISMIISEEDFNGVELGQLVRVRLASRPNEEFTGEVSWIAPVANTVDKTRQVYVHVDAPIDVMAPGLTGEGYLVKNERQDTVIIPRRALIGHEVYVVSPSGRVEIRQVQPGFLGLNRAEIVEGVQEGELVIVEGQADLRTGDKVNVQRATEDELR